MTAATSQDARPRLRADARRNRDRVVAAAREMMVEHGAEVSLDEVARRAGVGNATLYRNFADRADLVHHVTLSVLSRVADQAERSRTGESDPFRALSAFAHAAADERVGALCLLLNEAVDRDHPDLAEARVRMEAAVDGLMSDARASGQLRPDVERGDLTVALTQLTRPLPGCGGCPAGSSPGTDDDRSAGQEPTGFDRYTHRHLDIFLDGLRAPGSTELPGHAATLEALRRS
ncbi:TetR/AcrR family transcriptional regulator [Streptomyces sp. NPDC059740]|uniref:TetR/AcrR family transcriptional regulator n=1 Tax=Streptomyces sp. NPDC059740 TaxID=3346926 RepID=UPI003651B8CF